MKSDSHDDSLRELACGAGCSRVVGRTPRRPARSCPGEMGARGRALRGRGRGRQRELGPAGRACSPGSSAPAGGRGEKSPRPGRVWRLSDTAPPGADVGWLHFSLDRICGWVVPCGMRQQEVKQNRPYVRSAHKLISASLSQGDCP